MILNNALLIKDGNNVIWEIMALQVKALNEQEDIYRYLYTKKYENQHTEKEAPKELLINSFIYKMKITVDTDGYLNIEKKELY